MGYLVYDVGVANVANSHRLAVECEGDIFPLHIPLIYPTAHFNIWVLNGLLTTLRKEFMD